MSNKGFIYSMRPPKGNISLRCQLERCIILQNCLLRQQIRNLRSFVYVTKKKCSPKSSKIEFVCFSELKSQRQILFLLRSYSDYVEDFDWSFLNFYPKGFSEAWSLELLLPSPHSPIFCKVITYGDGSYITAPPLHLHIYTGSRV